MLFEGQPYLILDACCGGRMMWLNKHHPNTVYIDIRKAQKGHIQKGFNPNHEVMPDLLMDFRHLAFPDNCFSLIYFDPPHLSTLTETSIMRKKFGVLNSETWQLDLTTAFKELWRVLDYKGSLLVKWNDIEFPYKELLSYFSEQPLVQNITAGQKALMDGHRSFWFSFFKLPPNLQHEKAELKEISPGLLEVLVS